MTARVEARSDFAARSTSLALAVGYHLCMRRWLTILLLLIMPAQLVWAAAAPYCGHETTVAGKKHFGHHEHRHQADGQVTPASGDTNTGGADHADCDACHPAVSIALPLPLTAFAPPTPLMPDGPPEPRYLSHVPSGPERPDRAELAAATRSAGGVEFAIKTA